MPKLAVVGPGSVFDLSNQRRLHPHEVLAPAAVLDRRRLALDPIKRLPQVLRAGLVEAGSDVANIDPVTALASRE